jgi:site-specific recombinase XerD
MLDKNMLAMYLDKMESNGSSISTRNLRLRCIQAFLSYAAADSTVIIHKAEILKVPVKNLSSPDVLKYMNENAISAMLAQPDPFSKKGLRDRFIMLLLYDTGARISEIVTLELGSVRFGSTPTVKVLGKRNKYRDVPLMIKTAEHFKNYIKAFHQGEGAYSDSPLFYTMRNGVKIPMDGSTIRKLIISYGNAARKSCAEIPSHVTPHMFRHSRAMHLYQHGMDLTLVSQWLGHSQLETTLIYAHADTEQKRKSIALATPKNSPLNSKLNSDRFTVTDDEMLKKLYGLK